MICNLNNFDILLLTGKQHVSKQTTTNFFNICTPKSISYQISKIEVILNVLVVANAAKFTKTRGYEEMMG